MDGTSSLSLDRLPVEIIQRIASYTDCETVFALSKTNKSLQHACYDRQVFRALLENCNGHGGAIWRHKPFDARNDSSVESCARWALADSKARAMGSGRKLEDDDIKSFLRWAPQLMALAHPLNASLDSIEILQAFRNVIVQSRYRREAAGLALCFTCQQLTKGPESAMEQLKHLSSPAVEDMPIPPEAVSHRDLLRILHYPLENPGSFHTVNVSNDSLVQLQYDRKAIVGVGVMGALLREALQDGRDSRREFDWGGLARFSRWSAEARSLVIPDVTHSPLYNIVQLPLPFTPYNGKGLSTCHLPIMTSQSYLEEGEWTGVYTMWGMVSRRIWVDPPMQGIKFKTTFLSEAKTIFLKAEGTDGVGSFELAGGLETETGKANMSKTYTLTPREFGWQWRVYMTPFGLVGNWEEQNIRALNGPGGWVWLWKKVERQS